MTDVQSTPPVAQPRIAFTRTRILAYLGQLQHGEFVSSGKIINDLQLRRTTAKNTLDYLEERGLVEKRISNDRRVVAEFRIHPDSVQVDTSKQVVNGLPATTPYLPPEWSDVYGKHPHSV